MTSVSLESLVTSALSGDRLVSFPTDTVPALAVRPDRAELIFDLKQRSHDKPLILMAAQAEDLWEFVVGTPLEWQAWRQMAERYWPGALTLVLPASDRVPPGVNPTSAGTIGLRVPNHAVAQAVLAQTGPLATTSVNRSGEPPLQTMPEIADQFPQVQTLLPAELERLNQSLIDSPEGSASLGQPSTVIQWTGDGWNILRQGVVNFA